MSDTQPRPPGELTRDAAIEMVRKLHEDLGRPISRKEFLERTGLNDYWLDCTFPGAWGEVRALAGMGPVPQNVRYSDDELLAGFHRAVTALDRLPRWKDVKRLTGISNSAFRHRWQRMPVIVQRYREWLEQHHPDSPLRHMVDAAPPPRPGPRRVRRPARDEDREVHPLPGPGRRGPPTSRGWPPESCSGLGRTRRWRGRRSSGGRSTAAEACAGGTRFGEPIDCRHMRHAPVNEQGVVLLFGILAPELGFLVESVQNGFPDCEAKQAIDQHGRTWRQVRIEFEYRSRNFRDHGHDPGGCDLLVCWQHDWLECPLEVLELRGVVAEATRADESQTSADHHGQA